MTSYTEVNTYLDCRKRHDYAYGQQLESNRPSTALSDGKIGHAVLEVYYRNRQEGYGHADAVVAAHRVLESSGYVFDTEGKRADLNVVLFDLYFPNEPYAQKGYTVLAVEREWVLTWDGGEYKFVVDLILRDPYGKIVIVDHKFSGRFMEPQMLQLLPQLVLYIGAIRAQGKPVDYGEYNELNMTKVAKKRTVQEGMRQQGVIPSSARVLETFRQQVGVAAEITALEGLTRAERSERAWRAVDKVKCGMCEFKLLCAGELAGSNVQLIKNVDFRPRTKKTFHEEEM